MKGISDNSNAASSAPEKGAKRQGRPTGYVRLALAGIRTNGWMNFKLCFVLACLAFLVCLFTGFNTALSGKREELVNSSLSAQYVAITPSSKKTFPEEFAQQYFPGQEGMAFYRANLTALINSIQNTRIGTAILRTVDFFAEGNAIEPKDGEFKFNCYSSSYLFTEEDQRELAYRTGDGECLIGRYPTAADEIVLAETMLENYGLGRDMLGKRVAVQIKGTDAPALEGTVVGIIRKEYYTLSGHDNWPVNMLPIMIAWEEHPIFRGARYTVQFRLDRLYTKSEAEAIVKDAAARFNKTVSIIYGGNAATVSLWMIDNILTLANTLYVIIGSALAMGLILTVFLMIGKYVKLFARRGGILMSAGLTRAGLYGLLLLQLLFLGVFTVPLSAFLTVAGYLVVGEVMKLVTGVTMEITAPRLAGMLCLGLVIVLVIAFFFFILMALRLRKKTVRELLTTEVN